MSYQRLGFAAALVALLQAVAAPVVSTALLAASAYIRGIEFGDTYVALAIISALLYFLFLRAQLSGTVPGLVSGWTLATGATIAWFGVIAALLLIGYVTKTSAGYSRQALLIWFVATPPLVTGSLIVLRQWLRWSLAHSGNTRSAIIAGVNENSVRLAEKISRRPEMGLNLEGFFDDRGPERLGDLATPILGRFTDLPEYTRKNNVDAVFIAIPTSQVQRARDLLSNLRDTTASVYFVPDVFVFDLIQARADDLYGIPVVAICETPFNGWRGVMKRISDIFLALMMLLVALPTMVVVALGVKMTSRGSVLFRQRRYGLDGQEIVVYKFRTMSVAEDGDRVVQATKDDDRITPFGGFLRRYSLDELPQLINVLQGRMSLVGPRPHAVAHNEEYRKLIPGYMVRHKVAPGITGLAQVNGCRGETENLEAMEKRVHYDLEYLTHWSLWMDVKILMRTLAIVFRDENAY